MTHPEHPVSTNDPHGAPHGAVGHDVSTGQRATRGYVSLHTHTEFSPQDAISRLGDLVATVVADGQSACSMTDHGTTAGAWKFVKECKDGGIKPILGYEAYLALVPDGSDRTDEDPGVGVMEWDDPRVRFARFAKEGMDAESGKKKRNTNNHLTILVRNETGWRNLCRITNAAEDSFYYKPLIDYALLKQHSEGLIVLSGCLGGPVASHVAMARTDIRDETGAVVEVRWDQARLDAARENLRRLIECAGRENVYVEIMEHGLASEGREHIKMLATLAAEAGVEVVATNDSHFIDSCDCHAQDAWLVVGEQQRGNKITVDTEDRWRFNGSGYWMRTEAEMRAIYPNAPTWQRAIDNTVVIAERIQGIDEDHPYGVIPFQALRLPTFPVPQDAVERWELSGPNAEQRRFKTASAFYAHERVLAGAKRRYGTITPEIKERLAFEEGVITGMGLEDYFLIVDDVIEWCRSDRGYPNAEFPLGEPGAKKPIRVGPGRGSAAGSAYSYCLGIVNVDPLENALLFERFLDVERVGMPDIDVDFESARRDEVYLYAAARYGTEYVARIGAFQNAKTKRAIKDAARALGLPVALADALAKLVPVKQGTPHTFAMLFEEVRDKTTGLPVANPEAGPFRAAVQNGIPRVASAADVAKVVSLARSFEDVSAGVGIHAAGVIISNEPLTSLIPMRYLRKDGEVVGVPVALWDGADIDDFGMLKLDALSLRNLDVVAAAVEHIATTTGEIVDPDALPHPNDMSQRRVADSYALLREGRTQGIFQLESDGITDLIKSVAPTEFSDLSATLALYRPGPMGADMHLMYADRKNNRADVDYSIYTNDEAERGVIASVLGDTFGTIVYQEQMMALSYAIADFDAAERNKLRKAVSKKKQKEIDALKVIFMAKGTSTQRSDGTPKVAFQTRTLDTVWITFNAAAAYLFNKSHTVAYGQLSYVTSYLKAAWPTQYGAAILSTTKDAKKRLPALKALGQDGITVDAPDINLSRLHTSPDPTRDLVVRLGLAEIRDVGSNAAHIVTEREANGPYTSMADVIARVRVPGQDKDGKPTLSRLGALAVEGLIEAGAFDCFGPRLGHMMIARAVADGGALPVPEAEWGHLERANRERIRLGVTTGASPLEIYRDVLAAHDVALTVDSETGESYSKAHRLVDDIVSSNAAEGENVTGLLVEWTPKATRRGDMMARFALQGITETIDGIVFPSTYEGWMRAGITLNVGDIVTICGDVRRSVITVTKEVQVENADGDIETVEQERDIEKTELIASQVVPVDVDNAPHHALNYQPTSRRRSAGGSFMRHVFNAKRQIEAGGITQPKTPTKTAAKPKTEPKTTPKTTSKTPAKTAPRDPAPTPAAPLVVSSSPLPAQAPASSPASKALWFRGGSSPLTGFAMDDDHVVSTYMAQYGGDATVVGSRSNITRLRGWAGPHMWAIFCIESRCVCFPAEETFDSRLGREVVKDCLGCAKSHLFIVKAKTEQCASLILRNHKAEHLNFEPAIRLPSVSDAEPRSLVARTRVRLFDSKAQAAILAEADSPAAGHVPSPALPRTPEPLLQAQGDQQRVLAHAH